MSLIKANSVQIGQSSTATQNFTLSVPSSPDGTIKLARGNSGATTQDILSVSSSGLVTVNNLNNQSFRNRIINGDMRIDQRNAGASVTPSNGSYTLDRWNFSLTQASKLTAQQVTISSPESAGNNNKSLKITSSSAYSIVSSDYFLLGQFIEGLNSSDLGWGTSGARSVTLSFWVKSSLTGTFGGVFANSATARAYPFTYTISSANTWEQKTITASGDTSGTWLTDSGIGIRVYFGLGVGSDFNGTAGAWGGGKLGATGATSVVGTNGATWEITGVQLEAGSTATEFERRPYGTELALCQRYYWKIFSTAATKFFFQGYMYFTTQLEGLIKFPAPMRSVPTVSASPASQFQLRLTTNNLTNIYGYAAANEPAPITQMLLYTSNSAVASLGYSQSVISNSSTTTYIDFSSEL